MDLQTARALSQMNTAFYAQVSASFSATRQAPWDGWRRVCTAADLQAGDTVRILDLACGNLRFERFLADGGMQVQAWAVDNCDELVALGHGEAATADTPYELHYQHVDVMEALLSSVALESLITAPPCDLSVSFGFMHHVPMHINRERVLRALAACTRPGGIIAISFWQFAHNKRFLSKAQRVEGGDAGDYLLGWQDARDTCRYCHSFSEAEIDQLVDSCHDQAEELMRYTSDGKSGDLNRYLLLRKR